MANQFIIHGLSEEGKTYRAALVAIQELHTETLYDSATQGRVYLCWKCQDFYPCETRKLADEGLGVSNGAL